MRKATERAPELDDPEWLRARYYGDGWSLRDIGNELDVGTATVRRYFKLHDIDRRSRGRRPKHPRLDDAEWLRREYWDNGQTVYDIADGLDVSDATVRYHMQRHDIDRRPARKQLAAPELDDEAWLREQYHDKGRTIAEIAADLDVTGNAVRYHMKRHDIDRRAPPLFTADASPPPELTDEAWLRREYHRNARTLADIGAEFDVSGDAVRHYMERLGIDRREGGHLNRDELPPTACPFCAKRQSNLGRHLRQSCEKKPDVEGVA